MKTEPQPRQHHEGEPPPESLIHHDEPTMLEQWLRGVFQKGTGFWLGVALVVGGLVAAVVIAIRVGGPSRSGLNAWHELAAVGVAPSSSLSAFGPDPNAGLPERLKEIAEAYPDTLPAQWAELRAASILLNEGSAELATSRRSAGAGKIVEADELYNRVYDEARDDAVKRMAALGRARAAEARLGLAVDDADHATLDEVLALYEAVVDEFDADTPEAQQAARLLRRLRRSDSIAFYEELSRYSPASTGIGSGLDLPGFDLAPGGSAPLDGLFGLPPSGGGGLPGGLGLPGGSGFPSGSTPAPGSDALPDLDGLNLSPSLDVDPPTDPAMPAPVGLPDSLGDTPAPDAPETPAPDASATEAPAADSPVPVDPEPAPVEPSPAPADTPAPAPEAPPSDSPSPAPDSPQVPDDPFGGTPSPSTEPAPADPPQSGDNR